MDEFLNFTTNINKLNHDFMGFIEHYICKQFPDINRNQVLLIKNIGGNSIDVHSTANFGYYTGTNISYNITELQKKGYLKKSKCKHDTRKVYLTLTEKGLNVLSMINSVFGSHSHILQELVIHGKHIKDINKILCKLQRTFEI